MMGPSTPDSSNAHAYTTKRGSPNVVDIKGKYQQAYNATLTQQRQMAENLWMFMGRQYFRYDSTNRQIRPQTDSPPWRVRMVSNMIIKAVVHHMGLLNQSNPEPYATAASGEDADILAAHGAQRLLWHLDDINDVVKHNRELKWLLLIFGCCAEKIYWDESALASEQDEFGTVKISRIGDVKLGAVEPFDLFLDPSARKFSQCRWLIHREIRSKQDVKMQYGIDVSEKDVITSAAQWILTNGPNTTYTRSGVEVMEYYEKPSTDFPSGRFHVLANDVEIELEHNELPYFKATQGKIEFPFVWFNPIPTFVYPQGMTLIEHIIPHQRVKNRVLSIRVENLEANAHPKILRPNTTAPFKMTGEPSQAITYGVSGPAPSYLAPPNLSTDNMFLDNQLTSEANAIAGSADVQEAAQHAGSKTLGAANLHFQQNSMKAGLVSAALEDGAKTRYQYMLALAQAFYTEKRSIRTIGNDDEVFTKTLKGSDLMGTDVRIRVGSARPRDVFFEQGIWERFLQYAGDLKDSIDPRIVFEKMLSLNIVEGLEFSPDKKRAMEENRMIRKGAEVLPTVYDNHTEHIATHKRDYVENGFIYRPEILVELHHHIMFHEAAMALRVGAYQPKPGEPPIFDMATGNGNPQWLVYQMMEAAAMNQSSGVADSNAPMTPMPMESPMETMPMEVPPAMPPVTGMKTPTNLPESTV